MTDTITINVEARPGGGWNPDWLFYPACPASDLIATIAGPATLTARVLDLLRSSKQYTIKVTYPLPSFGGTK